MSDRSFLTEVVTQIGILALASALSFSLYHVGANMYRNFSHPVSRSIKASSCPAADRLSSVWSSLTPHEREIANGLVLPDSIHHSLEDVGGNEDAIQQIRQAVLEPLQYPDLFQSPLDSSDSLSSSVSVLEPSRGILLYGPPGCGKTMLARAIAKESPQVAFLNVKVSSLGDKYYGESQKLVSAVFSLASKLSPCMIFIDEIDSFLRVRQSSDHEASAQCKAEFIACWDGLIALKDVVLVGATNRMSDIDPAALRRFSRKIHVSLPDEKSRNQIIRNILSNIRVEDDFDFAQIAQFTEGFSGSDLLELLRSATQKVIGECIERRNRMRHISQDADPDAAQRIAVRPLATSDVTTSPLYVRKPLPAPGPGSGSTPAGAGEDVSLEQLLSFIFSRFNSPIPPSNPPSNLT
ncbi:hypothetical protein H696_00724 [Fonticula alba]|uniref:AAA+ ATPase domain-containing protein n=1 Tax=Fonticula alba TaxID=691883 RepID=A0A058ZGT8_FONAL|nr:hypothetical protein H696_00724 [Fonticula alba]KCV73181.1 hypothetical protein H696_00724 [Fonticula alba]|eukprot:XP_009492882.1 hypothetical protein H696_00724 [Fonticula alba]